MTSRRGPSVCVAWRRRLLTHDRVLFLPTGFQGARDDPAGGRCFRAASEGQQDRMPSLFGEGAAGCGFTRYLCAYQVAAGFEGGEEHSAAEFNLIKTGRAETPTPP